MAVFLTVLRSIPDRKFSPSMLAGSSGIGKETGLFSMEMTVSNRLRVPSWIYCPSECRSVEKMTDAGKMPF